MYIDDLRIVSTELTGERLLGGIMDPSGGSIGKAAGELMKSIQFDHEEKRRNACKKAAARYVKRAEVLKVHLERKESEDSSISEEKRKNEDESTQSEDNNTQTQTKLRSTTLR